MTNTQKLNLIKLYINDNNEILIEYLNTLLNIESEYIDE